MGYLTAVVTFLFVLMKLTNKMKCPLDDIVLGIAVALSILLIFLKVYYKKKTLKL